MFKRFLCLCIVKINKKNIFFDLPNIGNILICNLSEYELSEYFPWLTNAQVKKTELYSSVVRIVAEQGHPQRASARATMRCSSRVTLSSIVDGGPTELTMISRISSRRVQTLLSVALCLLIIFSLSTADEDFFYKIVLNTWKRSVTVCSRMFDQTE